MRSISFSCLIIALIGTLYIGVISCDSNFAWTSFGANNRGTRNANDVGIRPTLSSANVDLIGVQSTYSTGGYVYTVPYVDINVAIVPSADGYLYCFHKNPLLLKWRVFLPDITEVEGDRSRTTPVRWRGSVLIGLRSGHVVSINYHTGEVEWSVLAHEHPFATITAAFTLENDEIFFGVSSLEESAAANELYPCCSFVGRFIAMSPKDGTILRSWESIDTSEVAVGPGQYSGVGIWGSQPLIYKDSIIFGTGNPYDVPLDVQTCQDENPFSFDCIHPKVYFNGIVSLNIKTFELNWYRRLSAYDAWVVACIFDGDNCPDVPGPDADFGMNGVLVEGVNTVDGKHNVVMVGQKSGIVWSLDAATGDIICSASPGPSGTLGGSSWGAATDGQYFYSANINDGNICNYINYPTYTQTYSGSWSRTSLATCSISWVTANPNAFAVGEDSIDYNAYHFGSMAVGPPALVNDLMIGTDASLRGSVVFIHQSSGTIVKVLDSGASIYSGVAVYDNCIYYGNGYDPQFGSFITEGNTFFEACVPPNGV